jgi:hypothetical protein
VAGSLISGTAYVFRDSSWVPSKPDNAVHCFLPVPHLSPRTRTSDSSPPQARHGLQVSTTAGTSLLLALSVTPLTYCSAGGRLLGVLIVGLLLAPERDASTKGCRSSGSSVAELMDGHGNPFIQTSARLRTCYSCALI